MSGSHHITRTWPPGTEDVGDSDEHYGQPSPPGLPAPPPPEGERYADRGVLGRGGMGEVRLTHDLLLERDLALKVARAPTTYASAGLMKEARTTARLEHPGIVPVYDTGRLEDGRAYYTMPVLRGRSLAQRIREAPDLAARLRLLRHFQDACEAMAYAHQRGLAHRDLKPANIMVGEFGETRVVDWGLATPLAEDPPPDGRGPLVGTPAYMSPEQAHGAPVTPAFDVFSLGATLHELLCAEPPRGPDGDAPQIPPVRSRCPEVPPELAAIADRATAPDPAARYPDAKALAADVEAWFEGRRVAAYTYTLREELARFVARWRIPLTVGAVMSLALIVALVVGWERTRAERNRAVVAEAAAVSAREASDRSLARALVSQARVATAADRQVEAEILAANALRFGPAPDALGVLARFGLEPRARRAGRIPVPDCEYAGLSPSGGRIVCIRPDDVVVYDATPGTPSLARWAGEATQATFVGEDHALIMGRDLYLRRLDLRTGEAKTLAKTRSELRLTLTDTPERVLLSGRGSMAQLNEAEDDLVRLEACVGHGVLTLAPQQAIGPVAWLCGDRTVQLWSPETGASPLFTVSPALGEPNTIFADGREHARVGIGTETGAAIVFEEGRGEIWRLEPNDAPIRTLSLSGDLVTVSTAENELRVWDMGTGRLLARLPQSWSSIRWRDDGMTLRLLEGAVEDWALPLPGQRHVLELGAGVSALDVSPGGDRIAAAMGDGTVRLISVADVRQLRSIPIGPSVVKAATFSADGERILVGSSGPVDASLLDREGEPLEQISSLGARRAGWLGDGTMLLLLYNPGVLFKGPDHDSWTNFIPSGEPRLGDLFTWSDGRGATVIDQADVLYRLIRRDRDLELTEISRLGEVRGIAGTEAVTFVAEPTGVARLDRDGVETARMSAPQQQLVEIVSTANGRLVAIGDLDGTIDLLDGDDLRLIATLRGHTGRISALAFDPNGRWLASGSWDGSMRMWDLRVLTTDTAHLSERLEAAWGRSLEQVLAR